MCYCYNTRKNFYCHRQYSSISNHYPEIIIYGLLTEPVFRELISFVRLSNVITSYDAEATPFVGLDFINHLTCNVIFSVLTILPFKSRVNCSTKSDSGILMIVAHNSHFTS